ncbi:MAG TPA: c-type cytochrome [Blastocatellia bacterium]|nr:c-type cytochrome [Blastocatellia bacterium]
MRRLIFVSIVMSMVITASNCSSTDPRAGQLERGKYLVENVVMCADCHTPRDERGEFVRAKWLQGSPLEFAPVHPMPAWVPSAPGIAGLPQMSEAEATSLLETGATPNGRSPRPPMPSFRLSHEDAVAVAAYLKSLRASADAPLTSQNR